MSLKQKMNEKDFPAVLRLHGIGKIKFALYVSPIFVVVVNITNPLIDLIDGRAITFNFQETIVANVLGLTFGILFSIILWLGNEKKYAQYVKNHNQNNL